MRIERFRAKGFGKLGEFEIFFEPGINLIKGPNEAGKSTLVEAILSLLFDDPQSTKRELKQKKSWGSEQGFQLEMDFVGNETGFNLYKDFDKEEVKLTQKDTQNTREDKKRVEEIIFDQLGLPSKQIFTATACMNQDELSGFGESAEAIKDKLESLITGGKQEILASTVLNQIQDKIAQIKKVGTKNLGEIQRYEKIKQELAYELEQVKKNISLISQKKSQETQISSALAKLNLELEAKKSQLEKAQGVLDAEEKLRNLEEKFFDLKTRIKEVQNSERVFKKLTEKKEKIAQVEREDIQTLEELKRKKVNLEEKEKEIERDQKEIENRLARTKRNQNLKTGILVFLSLFLISLPLAIWASKVFFLGTFLFFISCTFCIFRYSLKLSESKFLKAEVKKIFQKAEESEEKLRDNNLRLKSIFKKYPGYDLSRLKDDYEISKDLEREIRIERSKSEGFLGGKNLKDLEEELRKTTREMTIAEDRSQELRINKMKGEDYEKLKLEVEKHQQKKKDSEIQIATLRKELQIVQDGAEHQASLEERLEETELRLSRLKNQLNIYQITLEGIEAARKNVLGQATEVLEKSASGFLKEITQGKYEKIRFDNNLNFQVFSPELDDWVDPQRYLSRGTLDQIYLCSRLSLLNLIAEDKKPVVIMDDPFITFDQERRKGALKVLKKLAKTYQILLLSCHDFYDGYENQLIDLTQTTFAQVTGS